MPGFLAGLTGGPVRAMAGEPGAVAVDQLGYFSSFGMDPALLGRILKESLGRGGMYADLYFQHRVTNYLGLEDGEVNRAYCEVGLGCGVRVIKGDQTGFAFTEDLSPEALIAAARTAAAVAEGGATPPATGFTQVGMKTWYRQEVPWSTVGIDRKMPLLEVANKAARGHDPRISKVTVFLTDQVDQVLIATSDGRLVEDTRPMAEAYVVCTGKGKDRVERSYSTRSGRAGFEFYSPEFMEDLGRDAAASTVELMDATQPPAGEYPVVLAPGLSGILLHEAMGHGFEADFNRKGTSVFSGRIGQQIAPREVTIVDSGQNPGERGTLNTDDEATLSQETVLVKDGVLTSYMHDLISARFYGVKPTGNGRRESYKFPPVPRMRNTYMLAGPHPAEEIIASVKKGIYAADFMNGQVEIGSGDFSFYLKNGWMIEDGKLTRPVKDANLIGFGPKVLEKIEMVGDDMKLYSGAGYCGKDGQRVPVGFGLPTIKCGGISVGGA